MDGKKEGCPNLCFDVGGALPCSLEEIRREEVRRRMICCGKDQITAELDQSKILD